MIFERFLKGTDIRIDITLEKKQYKPGETVKGILTLMTAKRSKVRQLKLFAEGKELTKIEVSESTGSSSSSSHTTTTRTYSEINTFFSKDLSHFLQKSINRNTLSDGTLEILPQNKELTFDFTLPTDNSLFSSFKGKNANIAYTVKATVDIAKRLDIN